MKKNMLNLLAVSMIALLAGGLKAASRIPKAAQCLPSDKIKKVILKNTLQEDVRFLVMDSISPSTAGTMVRARDVVVPANKTQRVSYCKVNGGAVMDVTGVGLVNAPNEPTYPKN